MPGGNYLNSILSEAVIPSGAVGEVENGTAGKPGHRRDGRRLSEREVSESKPVASRKLISRAPSTPRFAQDDRHE